VASSWTSSNLAGVPTKCWPEFASDSLVASPIASVLRPQASESAIQAFQGNNSRLDRFTSPPHRPALLLGGSDILTNFY